MSDRLPLEAFQAELNRPFKVTLEGEAGTLELELATVRDLGVRQLASGVALPNYSLVFLHRGEKRSLPQRTYNLANATLGAMEIFLVPLGPDASGMRYEAIFN